jgi:ech hydrogenase subunit D
MTEEQPIEIITTADLLAKVGEKRAQGWRIVQIGATHLKDKIEINYSFDLNGKYVILRIEAPALNPRVPSISQIFWCAFIYENEMQDLFGIQVDNMAVDFKGKFYKMAVSQPFVPKTAPVVSSAPAPAPAAAVAAVKS